MDSLDPLPLPRLRSTPDDGRRATVPPGQLSGLVTRQGSTELRWHAPQGTDDQVPHDRDEVYVVVTGTAVFVRAEEAAPFQDGEVASLGGEERVAVQPGDALLVPAGTAHRFEATSSDFGAWAIFYGPEGGERR